MAAPAFISQSDPYSVPSGFTETKTPGGGSAYQDQSGNTYVRKEAGFELFQPPQSPNQSLSAAAEGTPAVITSQPARQAVTEAQNGLATELQRMTTGSQTAPFNYGGQQFVRQADGSLVPANGTGSATQTKTQAPTAGEAPATESPALTSTGDPAYDSLVKTMSDGMTSLREGFQTFQTQAEAIRSKVSTANASLIDSIRNSFARQIDNTQRINDSTLKGLTQAGIRAGRDRYTSETEDTALANEMREGVRRIADLEAKRDSLIAQTELANSKEDYEMLYKTWSEAQKATDTLNQTVLDLYKLRQANEKAAQDAAAAKLTNLKTITDLNQKTVDSIGYLALSALVGDEKKDSETLKAIAAQYGVDPNLLISKVHELDTKNQDYAGTVGEYRFYADQERAAGRVPLDYTSYLSLKERISNPARTTVSIDEEGNRTTSTTSFGGAASGAAPQGQPPRSTTSQPSSTTTQPTTSDPRVTALRDAVAALSPQLTKDKRTSLSKTIETHIGNGNIDTAKGALLSSAIASLPAEQQNKAYGRNVALDELDRIQTLLQDYEAKGGKTSLLKGTQEQIFQKLGTTSDPALAEIGNAIRLSIIAYRNAVSGAAFTESEMKEYQSIFPSDKKNAELNAAKIKSLRDAFTNNQSSVLATTLGGKDVYKSLTTQPSKGITVSGKFYPVGSTVTNAKGQQGKVNADGTITLIK